MDEAAQNFRIAVNMEPQNLEYRNALSSVGSGAYTTADAVQRRLGRALRPLQLTHVPELPLRRLPLI